MQEVLITLAKCTIFIWWERKILLEIFLTRKLYLSLVIYNDDKSSMTHQSVLRYRSSSGDLRRLVDMLNNILVIFWRLLSMKRHWTDKERLSRRPVITLFRYTVIIMTVYLTPGNYMILELFQCPFARSGFASEVNRHTFKRMRDRPKLILS